MMISTEARAHVVRENGGCVYQGKRFESDDKLRQFLIHSSPFDTLKVLEEKRSYFLHRTCEGFEQFGSRIVLRKHIADFHSRMCSAHFPFGY